MRPTDVRADIETPGDLSFADAGAVEFQSLPGLLSRCHGPPVMLSPEPRFGNARTDPFAEDSCSKAANTESNPTMARKIPVK
jgi:hypothetical protein